MGTTVSATYITNDTLYWGHVGDSRIYLIRAGVSQLLTEDHSFVWHLIKKGELSEEEASSHPRRNMLIRAVGTAPETEIDVGEMALLPGDQIILCTDGLSNLLSGEEIADVTTRTADPDETVKHLINLAKDRGGFDNITVILIDSR
jgi:protein phosphatase